MSNAAITTLVNNFACVTVDTTAQQTFQDEVINELARGGWPGIIGQVGTAFIAVTRATNRYSLPSATGARTILAVFYDDTQLLQINKQEVRAYEEAWRRTPQRKPIGYCLDPEDRVSFSLVPSADRDGQTIGGNTPTNITAWPEGNLTVIYANADTAFAGTTY